MTHPIIQKLFALDAALQAKKFPAMTDWWADTLASFYESGKRELVIRAGRRGGKSTTLMRLAVCEALYGSYNIPPGDVGVVSVVSINRDEAAKKIRLVKSILDALGVKWKPMHDGIELLNRPVAFQVFSASIGGVSGFTSICGVGDELAKWKDKDAGTNPATEVLNSWRPTFAGHPNAKLLLCSSPMGKGDAHAQLYDKGSTKQVMVVPSAPTWVVRPTLTEAECRDLAEDPDIFMREYACVPFDGSTSSMFSTVTLDRVILRGVTELPPEPDAPYFAAEDAASRANAHTVVIARPRRIDDDSYSVEVVFAREFRAPRGGVLDTEEVYREIAADLKRYRVTELFGDQWSFDARAAVARRHGVELRQVASTAMSKVQHFGALRRRVNDRTVAILDVPEIAEDLCGVRQWISRAGAFTVELEKVGGRHCDFAPSVALVVHKVSEYAREAGWFSEEGRQGMSLFIRGGDPPDPKAPPLTLVRGASSVVAHGRLFDGATAEWSVLDPTATINFSAKAPPEFRELVEAERRKWFGVL